MGDNDDDHSLAGGAIEIKTALLHHVYEVRRSVSLVVQKIFRHLEEHTTVS